MPKASRRCSGDKGNCTNLIRFTKYCPEHTNAWAGTRTKNGEVTGTAAWKRVRLQILKRDNYQCQISGPHYTGRATQVDHIVNTAAGGPELEPANLQSACTACHQDKSQSEASIGRASPSNTHNSK
ncbi:HNH endonuclease [Mycobacteroides abscessus]|uniref:HNH endonuclease n=1 Tax=Mycobacteroides abscessus TaxID=36809 RepID=UPI0009406F12|nr:HNH endonuclease signature motif containing protein [Mycobacteroides abscessus]